MITTQSLKGDTSPEQDQQPRAKLVTKDGQAYDHGPVQIGVTTIERMESRKYVYTGQREGIYRIFREV
jgi:hypothetical protein